MTTGQNDLPTVVRQALDRAHCAGQRLCVGLSGGLDSVVLLHVLAQLRTEISFKLTALHVHHGLSANADAWESFCQTLCAAMDIPCAVVRLQLPDATGKGLERVAREARYAAFESVDSDVICLAHHENDRAETFLLNLFRGAGSRGLAGLPEARRLGDKRLLRPLITMPREMVASWAHAQGLRWIEDESNDNLYFRRNHVRHRVLPAVTETFPGVVGVLAHTAALVGEQAQLLDRLAVIDGAACRDGGDASKKVGYLSVARLRQLPEPAVRNVLRLELHQAGVQIPSAGRLQTLSDQVMHAADDSRVFVRIGGIGVHVWRDRLWIDRALCGACPKPYPVTNGVVAWPDGTLRIREPLVGQKTLQVAPLGHGQRFQPKGRCRGSVTEFLREQGVPPWMRPRLPGLWSADHLVWVAGLGWADALPQTQAGDAVAWSARPLVAL